MKRQVVVAGLGRFGFAVAINLSKRGHEVLAIDQSERKVQEILPHVTHAAQADITNEPALRELGVPNFDLAVLGVSSDLQVSLLGAVLLLKMTPYVIAQASNDLHGMTLEKLGVHRVVYPSREAGERLAHRLGYPDVVDYMEVTQDYGISKVTAPAGSVGGTLEDAGLGGVRSKTGLSVLLVKRGNDIILTPDRFERIEQGDILIVTGKDRELEKLEEPAVLANRNSAKQ